VVAPPAATGAGVVNAMSVDVEDYFQVSAFEDTIPRSEWDSIPPRVEESTRRVMDLFARHDVRCTFFVLGWVAERFPALIRDMVSQGHELGSHGYSHVRATQQDRDEFARDVVRTKNLLEDISGVEVAGYRAASFSIGRDNLWALDVLAEAGHRYSSSIYPVHHDLYGMPEASRFPFHHGSDPGILEIPVSTARIMGRNVPCGGGGYFRLLPYAYFRWALRRLNRIERQPSIFYFHPWEVDPGQPRQEGLSLKSRFRHYTNLAGMSGRLERLLAEHRWGRMADVFAVHRSGDAVKAA
jgi:polysaccharide deacetylase family protein (PEP-CTERM system associated)